MPSDTQCIRHPLTPTTTLTTNHGIHTKDVVSSDKSGVVHASKSPNVVNKVSSHSIQTQVNTLCSFVFFLNIIFLLQYPIWVFFQASQQRSSDITSQREHTGLNTSCLFQPLSSNKSCVLVMEFTLMQIVDLLEHIYIGKTLCRLQIVEFSLTSCY